MNGILCAADRSDRKYMKALVKEDPSYIHAVARKMIIKWPEICRKNGGPRVTARKLLTGRLILLPKKKRSREPVA